MSIRSPTPTALSWSGGKDSALALHALLTDPAVEVRGLLTTITDAYDRVSMHGVRRVLVAAQAEAVGVRLWVVNIPSAATNEQYERAMLEGFASMHDAGIEAIAFGDLFLEDVRAYRERLVARSGLRPTFPLWGKSTADLARQFTACGFKAVVVCVDPRQIDVSHCGSEFDGALLRALPSTADPCARRAGA